MRRRFFWLINYVSPEYGACWDVQRGETAIEALAAHLKLFPWSTSPKAKVLA